MAYDPNIDPVLDSRRRASREQEATAEADARAAREVELLATRKRFEDEYFARNPSESRYAGQAADTSLDAPRALPGAPMPTPGAPPVPPSPAATVQAQPSMSDFQRRYAQSYMAQQQKGEAPTADERVGDLGAISYDLGDGNGMRAYNRGPNPTQGSMGAPEFAGDNVFGQSRTTPVAAGGVSSPGGSDSAAYQRYRQNLLGDSEYAAERAGISESGARAARGRALTANPFAAEDRSQQRAFELEAARSMFGSQRDAQKEQAKLQPYFDLIDNEAAQHVKTYESTPDGTVTSAGPMTPGLRQKLIQDRLRLADEEKKDAASRLIRARTVNEPDPAAVS